MEILRDIIEDLKRWKDSANRKPILLKGARQIGKTWVMQQFGKQCYEHCVRFDFDRQEELKTIFSASKEPKRIIRELSVYSDVPLLPGKTLIIFDEIQQLIQLNDKIVPVEVKAENAISGRSLDVYNEKFKPETRIRFSMLNLQMNGGLLSCPAPLAEWAAKWC